MAHAHRIDSMIRARRRALISELHEEEKTEDRENAGHEYILTHKQGFRRASELGEATPVHYFTPARKKKRLVLDKQPVKIKTPNLLGKYKLFCQIAISPWFALGCGLTVAGSLLSALMILSGGSTILMPFLLSTSFMFLMALGNWKTIQKRVPEVMHALFSKRLFKRLFRCSAKEYRNLLHEYWIDLDDRIAQARRHIKRYQQLQNQGKKLNWNQRRKYKLALKDYPKLTARRKKGEVPPRDISPIKKKLLLASFPFHLAGGFMIGVLTYNLSVTTIIQAIAYFTGAAAAFASPPMWILGIGFFLALITAPTMLGIFVYGTSCFAKVYRPLRKIKHFTQNLFKEVIENPKGEGFIRTYTRRGIIKGCIKIAVILASIVITLIGNVAQMFGGAYMLNDFMKGPAGVVSAYIIASMALLIHSPFYILQMAKTAKGWFQNRKNYFRHPIKVLEERIERIKSLTRNHNIGKSKARLLISKLEHELTKFKDAEVESANRWHRALWVIPVPGKYWMKMPHWLRDVLEFKLSSTVSTVGKGFLSYFGAMKDGSISLPDDGGYVPDAFFNDSLDEFDPSLFSNAEIAERDQPEAQFKSSKSAKIPPVLEKSWHKADRVRYQAYTEGLGIFRVNRVKLDEARYGMPAELIRSFSTGAA